MYRFCFGIAGNNCKVILYVHAVKLGSHIFAYITLQLEVYTRHEYMTQE